ncbi:MAG: FHA domain-containing protein [Clostridia bacterium]|nr:FHA domain-containing protein [Clostridia bacterium]
MQVKKGPYGIFITESVSAEEFSKYAFEIINNFVYHVTVTVYAYEYFNHIELSYDISALTSFDKLINNQKNSKKQRLYVRKMIGSLISGIINGLDYLLIPANWIIDIKHIYYDEENNCFKFIYLPTAKGNSKMNLSSDCQNSVEKLINDETIKPHLSEDEINSISYYFREKNEEKLIQLANNLSSDAEFQIQTKLSHTNGNQREKKTCITAISILIIIAILNFIKLSKITGLIIAVIALISIVIMEKEYLLLLMKKSNSKNEDKTNLRTEILFEDKESDIPDFKYATISSISKINGEFIKKSLIADSVTIGSDCFLSDIVINSDEISPLHAKISINESGYTLTDLSKNNTTYLENKRIIPNKNYEIKNGELITFGKYDFEFKAAN